MKTIAELQGEIRSLKKELNKRLDALEGHLSDYKVKLTEHSEFKRVYDIAMLLPVIEHPISKMDFNTKTNYMGILLFFATFEQTMCKDQLLFLQRMILADSEASSLDVYLGNLGKITIDNILYHLDDSIVKNYAHELVLDLLILIHLSRERDDAHDNRKKMEILADIAGILKMPGDVLSHIVIFAKAVLMRDLGVLTSTGPLGYSFSLDRTRCEILYDRFSYYLKEIPGYNQAKMVIAKNLNDSFTWCLDSYLFGGSH